MHLREEAEGIALELILDFHLALENSVTTDHRAHERIAKIDYIPLQIVAFHGSTLIKTLRNKTCGVQSPLFILLSNGIFANDDDQHDFPIKSAVRTVVSRNNEFSARKDEFKWDKALTVVRNHQVTRAYFYRVLNASLPNHNFEFRVSSLLVLGTACSISLTCSAKKNAME